MVIYSWMYNEVTRELQPTPCPLLQPLSELLLESASVKRDEYKLRTHPFRSASLALARAGGPPPLFIPTRDGWSHQVMHPLARLRTSSSASSDASASRAIFYVTNYIGNSSCYTC